MKNVIVYEQWLNQFNERLRDLLDSTENPDTGKRYTLAELDARTVSFGHRVSQAHIHKLLHGVSNNPNLKTIIVLSLALDVTPDYFFLQEPLQDSPILLREEKTTDSDLSAFTHDLRNALKKLEEQHGLSDRDENDQ